MMTRTDSAREVIVNVGIIGASLGGVAAEDPVAALSVVTTEAAAWVGGQLTAQGVSAPDEHPYIESFGATARYLRLRQQIRQTYIVRDGAPPVMPDSVLGPNLPLNPGNGWVSRLCFLPARAHELMLPTTATRLIGWRAVAAESDGETIHTITIENAAGVRRHIRARFFLDATDLGELLPLTETEFVTGAEAQADTGEPHAAAAARPDEAQSFTFGFAIEYCPGEDHTVARPQGYEFLRDHQPYTLSPVGRDGQPVVYRMFEVSPDGNLPFWSYRRLHNSTLLGGGDIALINWISNDYYGGDLLTASPDDGARFLEESRRLSLGFLHWLQTECPRDDGGVGYPELKLRPDVMGTDDGLAQMPYIRESRRIVSRRRIVEQDIAAAFNPGARARHMTDSIGIGWYSIDLHPCVGNPSVSLYAPTKPFQIPLGALVPTRTRNLIPACKNIGTTHLTNGAYRLHPVEWAIGEAAGTLAAFCLEAGLTPAQVAADSWQIWRLQARLVQRGCPIFWAVDVPIGHPAFAATQLLLVSDVLVPDSPRWHSLAILGDQPLGDSVNRQALAALDEALCEYIGASPLPPDTFHADRSWFDVCRSFEPRLQNGLLRKGN